MVELAAERLGIPADSDTRLARALGLDGYAAPQRVRRWRLGQNEPDFGSTLLLLEAAGLLRDEATSPPAASAHAAPDDLRTIIREELERAAEGPAIRGVLRDVLGELAPGGTAGRRRE